MRDPETKHPISAHVAARNRRPRGPDTSRRRAEFRLAVVGHLCVRKIEPRRIRAELKALSRTKWIHPLSGKEVVYGFSTIERWYYNALQKPESRLETLYKRRRDSGSHRSLPNPLCRYLTRQATRHPWWSASQHYRRLVQYIQQHTLGSPPSYTTIQRYLQELRTSPNRQSNTPLEKLKSLVAHLKRTLVLQSTLIWLLRVPALRLKAGQRPFKYSRFEPNQKLYILSRLREFRSVGGSRADFCAGIGIAEVTIERWGTSYRRYGESGLCVRKRRKFPNRSRAQELRLRMLEIFHSPPRAFGINRASWTGESLAAALHGKYDEKISACSARRYLRRSGYTMRRARQVLTSSDPAYQEKVSALVTTLQGLKDGEELFFVDELGPLAVRKYGGRAFVKKGESFVVPQIQSPRGSIILAAALSATQNRMTWCYARSKDTNAMIDLIEILFNEHRHKKQLYITWDAASWHDSIALVSWLDDFNRKTRAAKEGPLIAFVPLPSCSQFLNIIESVFSVMKKAVVHHSDYQTVHEMKSAISRHFRDRNAHFKDNPRRAGNKIWEIDFFRDPGLLPSGNYREY